MSLWPFRGLYEKTTPGFRASLERLASDLGIDAQSIAGLISIETAGTWRPDILNPLTKAHVGLIQFSRETARDLGTSIEALASMSAEEQLRYVGDYLQRVSHGNPQRLNSPTRLYMAVFYPEHMFSSGDTVIAAGPSKVFEQNQGFDRDKDGTITVAEVGQTLENVVAAAKNRPIPGISTSETGTSAMSKTAIISYAERLKNDWAATDRLVEKHWYRSVNDPYRTGPVTLPFETWRADYYSFLAYHEDLTSRWHIIVTKDEYGELVKWHRRLQQWQDRFGPAILGEDYTRTPIPPLNEPEGDGGALKMVASAVTAGLIVAYLTKRQ